jgi:hypothetical protein
MRRLGDIRDNIEHIILTREMILLEFISITAIDAFTGYGKIICDTESSCLDNNI